MFIQGHLTISVLSYQRQVFVVVVFQIRAHSTQVPSSHQASRSEGFSCQMKTYDFHFLSAYLRSAGECTEGTYQDDDYGYYVTAIIYVWSISQVLRIEQL